MPYFGEQQIEEYRNTVEENKQAIKEIIQFIGDEAFNSGGDLKDWLDSFGFGRSNMMWPIPTIRENECEICCTFYYLPQIVTKNSINQFPRPFPLPTNPVNITWENGFPKLESNWKFELFPQPPVTICWRKDKPGCRPEPPPRDCILLEEYQELIKNPNLNLSDLKPPCPFPDPDLPFDPEYPPPFEGGYEFRTITQGFYSAWYYRNQGQLLFGNSNYPVPDGPRTRTISNSHDSPIVPWGCRFGFHFWSLYESNWGGRILVEYWSCEGDGHGIVDYFPNTSVEIRNVSGGGTQNIQPPLINPPIIQESQMECCEECLKILRKLDRDMTRLMKWTGATSDGVKFPEFIQNKDQQGWLGAAWDLITPDEQREIHSIPEFWKYSMEKMMEILGVPPYKIEDSNGNELGFPNVGTLLTNQVNKLIKLQEGIDLAHLALAKDLLETGLTRQQLIFATSLISAVCDWGNIELRERQVEIYHQFAFPKDQDVSPEEVDTYKELDEFLKTSKWNTKEAFFDSEKDIGGGKKPEHFGDTTKRLLKILDILNAVHGVRIDPNDIEGSVRRFINEYRKFSKGQALDGKVIGDDDTNDSTVWAKKVESEFSSETNPPVGSTDNPWGNVASERPRIIIRGETPTEADDME